MELMDIKGVRLEVMRITPPEAVAGRAPIVFLHEGLGSVAMWIGSGSSWPEAVCAACGRHGVVYSRRGYGQPDPVPDVRGAGRLPPDYMHLQAWEVLPALLEAWTSASPCSLATRTAEPLPCSTQAGMRLRPAS